MFEIVSRIMVFMAENYTPGAAGNNSDNKKFWKALGK